LGAEDAEMQSNLRPLVRLSIIAMLLFGLFGALSSESLGWPAQSERTRISEEATLAAMPIASLEPSVAEQPDEPRVTARYDSVEPLAPDASAETLFRICRVTAYCDRGTTAAGVPSGVGQCAAPGYVPLGSLVYIPEFERTFVVTDRTHRRFRNSTVDIFIPSETECREFGRSFLECEIVVDSKATRLQRLGRR
jgi:3D (Asp-Asp-Asp) domain-containing protein